MVEKNIKGVNKLINEALIFKQRGDLIRAERLLSKAIKIDPKNFIAFNNIGSIYSARNKPEEAKNFFLKAIHFKPDYGNAIFNLALINEEMGNKQEAIKYYKEAIKIDPKNLSFHHNLSRVDKTYFSTLDSNEIGDTEAKIGINAAEIHIIVEKPKRSKGQMTIVHEAVDQVENMRKAWVYIPGTRRVRRVFLVHSMCIRILFVMYSPFVRHVFVVCSSCVHRVFVLYSSRIRRVLVVCSLCIRCVFLSYSSCIRLGLVVRSLCIHRVFVL